MRSPEEHLAAVRELVPARGVVTVPLIDTPGRTLARELTAAHPSPRFDNSQMDGFALSAVHLAQAPGEFTVGETLAAGTDPDALYPAGISAAIVPIMTGAKVPQGTAAVVPVEACDPPTFPAAGARIRVTVSPTPGQFIRPAGSDITAGQALLPAGTTLGPVAVGVLAGQNLPTVEVLEQARVLICTGGAEIGGTGAADIPDANGPMLHALCQRAGIQVAARLHTDDDPARLRADLAAAVAEHRPTAIITSGGISAGKFEVVRRVLEAEGWFGHVDQQPGGPQGLARFDGVPVICLPGNPVSTLVSFRLFVAPVLGTAPAPLTLPLARDAAGLPDRDQFLRGRITTLGAEPVGGAGSHLLVQALAADCLIRIPAPGGLLAGEHVEVHPL
ncbi:molybdopterin molybdenumtransferase MoeA [Corynebacterium hylobatis]|uniref:Molybdopterin molybdenumtransferase n=1 Tax=Corynebacterium hylobatis TaxID=1859290 RepID=A0A3S0B4M2_9CORY|nr:molybdopterin molybdotransferase MoeA [Corynebacterium hylobatis]RSZ63755.1 molybdopterin molybdenumtransferase MoeA [Corynebacterium hylobatis]